MTKQELIDFLEDELIIRVSLNRTSGYYNGETLEVKVSLLLKGGEELCTHSDECSLPEPNKDDGYY